MVAARSTRTEVARAAVPYLMKYLSKGSDTMRLPAGARMYGVGGLSHSHRRTARWLRLPSFIQARSDISDDWKSAPGGGWLDPTGGWLSSEFRRTWLGDAYGLMRVANHGRRANHAPSLCPPTANQIPRRPGVAALALIA